MSIPGKHHYLPEWFIRRWADADECVSEYRRTPNGKLWIKRRHPAATGYMHNLYANDSKADPLQRQALELVFMQKVDSRAADALAYIEQHRRKPWDWTLRGAWSRFLKSLLHRSPERVAYITNRVKDYESGELIPDLEARYTSVAGPDDPPTFDEWLAQAGSITADLRERLIKMLIDSDLIGDTINSMYWRVHTLEKLEFGLVAGDLPLMMSNGLGHEGSFIMLPIAPTRLFIAAHNLDVIHSFTLQYPSGLELAVNDAVARQSSHIVIARDDALRGFVDERLRKDNPSEKSKMLGYQTWNSPLRNLRPMRFN